MDAAILILATIAAILCLRIAAPETWETVIVLLISVWLVAVHVGGLMFKVEVTIMFVSAIVTVLCFRYVSPRRRNGVAMLVGGL